MEPQPSDESRVLIIYTGGTIGMLVGHQGYVPEPYFLTETLRSQTRFHDPHQDSLFSNSASVEGFRTWTKGAGGGSGKSTPVPSRPHSPHQQLDAQNESAVPPLHTLLVRSSRPIGEQFLGAGSPRAQFPCTKIANDVYEAPLPSLVTPSSSVPGSSGRKRIRYAILEWNPLLDSSNLDLDVRLDSHRD